MKRVYVTLGLIALVALFSLPGSGQMDQGVLSADQAGMLGSQAQIQLLAAINRAGLSLEQMETIQSALQTLLAGRDAVVSAQQTLKDFLIRWNGAPAQFDAAYAQAQEQVSQAVQALKDQGQAALDAVKNTLTVSQGEILMESLGLAGAAGHGVRAALQKQGAQAGSEALGRGQNARGQAGALKERMGRDGAQAEAQSEAPSAQGKMARSGAQGQARGAQSGNLGWLARAEWVSQALSEKIAALKNP
ncbi:MAG TPA: hypothetical protein VIL47_00615 [Candidatus Bipolaricaulota bacterium]